MNPNMWWYRRFSWPHLLARWLMLFATTGYVFLPSSVVWANPTGEEVVGGSATFERNGNTLTVNQTTDRLAVNWQDFSIAAGETTHFNMPSSASIALNRVLGGNPSQIYGTLSSNGNIILVNNAGIFVGPGGVVNTASFVGSTLDIDPEQFMHAGAGGYQLRGDSYAPIVNQGNITAEKGDVFLIAQKVENRGTISAPNGRASLVGVGRASERTEVVLHEVGGSGFAVRVTQLEGAAAQGMNGDLPDGEELLNEGEIAAAQAELNASGNIYALAIRNSGTIRAKAVVAQADGTVRLDGGMGDVQNTGTLMAKNAGEEATAAGGKIEVTGQNVTASPESILTAAGGVAGGNGGKVKIDSADTTIVQGKVDVAAPSAEAKGGKVELLGDRVGLFDGAKVNASGGAGGGTVLVGGDYLGGQTPKPELKDLARQEAEPVKNAKTTVMAETAEIKADAIGNGDGGKVILWSDEYTGFYGQIFAQGGAEGGNGGFVETSSLGNLQAWGNVWVESTQGRAGTWLLDPVNVTITSAASTNGVSSVLPPPGGFTWVPTALGSNVEASAIDTALSGGATVTITTAGTASGASGSITEPGNITVGAAISGAGNLTLAADNNIDINAPITLAGGDLTLTLAGKLDIDSPVQVRNLIMVDSAPAATIAISSQVQTTGNIKFLVGEDFKLNSDSALDSGGSLEIVSTSGSVILLSNVLAIGDTSITSGTNFQANGTLTGSSVFVRANGGNATLNNAVITTGVGGNGRVQVQSGTGNINLNSGITSGNGSSISIAADDGSIQVSSGATLSSGDNAGNVSLSGRTGVNLAGVVRSFTGEITVESGAGAITRNGAPGANRVVAGTGGLRLEGNAGVTADIDTGGRAVPNFKAYANEGSVSIDSIGGAISLNAAAANNLSVTSDDTLTIIRLDDRDFSGANVSLNTDANNGYILLGGNRIVGTTSFTASPNGTGRIQLNANQDGNEVSAPTQNYNGPVDINSATQISGNTEINFNRVLDLLAAGLTVFANGDVRFNDDVLLTSGDLVVDGLAAVDMNSVNGPNGLFFVADNDVTGNVRLFDLIGDTDPVSAFVKEAGSIEFQANDDLTVLDIDLSSTGRLVLLGVNLRLAANTFLETNGDITLDGTIEPFNTNDANGFRLVSNASSLGTSGQVILNGNVGAVRPLGLFEIDTSAGNGDILINAPVRTRPSELTPDGQAAANNGKITLNAGGNVVLTANLTTDVFNAVAGDIELTAGSGPGLAGNIQIGRSATDLTFALTTRGGDIIMNSDTFIMGASSLSTAQDNLLGGISFLGRLDGAAPLTLQAGTGAIDFTGSVGGGGAGTQAFVLQINSAGGVDFQDTVVLGSGANQITSLAGGVQFRDTLDVLTGGNLSLNLGAQALTFDGALGSINPFGLSVDSAGGVQFNAPVLFGAAATINSLSGNVVFAGTLDVLDRGTVTLNVGNRDVTLGTVGSLNPLGNFTVSTGSGRVNLTGDITTAAGTVTFGPDVRLGANVAINTTALNFGNGANIVFRQDLEADSEAGGGRSLSLNAGVGGNIQFGAGTSSTVGNRLGSLSVAGGAPGIVGAGGGFSMLGRVTALGLIDINSPVNPLINGGVVLFTSVNDNIQLRQGILGQSSSTQGSDVDLSASAGTVTVGGNITLNGASFVGNSPGFRGGNLTVLAQAIDLKDITTLGGGDNEVLSPGAAEGGSVELTATAGGITTGVITTQGGEQGLRGTGGRGGNITLDARGTVVTGYLDSSGGDTAEGVGGNAGNIAITSGSDLRVPIGLLALGGAGTDRSAAFAGRGGTVTVVTDTAGADIAFSSDLLTLEGDMNLFLRSAGHLVMGTVADFATPLEIQSGTVLTYNARVEVDGQVTPSQLLNRGRGVFEFGLVDATAQFLMPAFSSVLTYGGSVVINRVNGVAPVAVTDGLVTISGTISTSARDRAGGQVAINTSLPGLTPVDQIGAVRVNSAIDTRGGESTSANSGSQYGRNGGAVTIAGTAITVNQILTQGSASQATATVPAFGGAGGNISLTAPLITLRRNLDSSGGAGQGTGDAQGGGGGEIVLAGDVILDSGRGDLASLVLNSQGGTLSANGANGVGGDITVTGKITGTATTSHTLDLRYGSGTATLGNAAADTISLQTLITAADDPRSEGNLVVNGALLVDSLTTFGRGYSIQLAGDGSIIGNAVTFLNQGTVTLGGTTGQVLTFTGGFDALTGTTFPATVYLGGTVVSGPGDGAAMKTGVTVLIADSTLDSNGNDIEIGQLDATTAETEGLTLGAGIGAGLVLFNSQVGGVTALGAINVQGGATDSDATSVTFADQLSALSLQSGVNSELEMVGDVSLTEDAQLLGVTSLNNTGVGEVLNFAVGTASSFGVLNLEGVESGLGIQFTAAGDLQFTEAVVDPVNLLLAGAGSKNFQGALSVGTGTGASVQLNAGSASFADLTTAAGITSAVGTTTTFNGAVTLAEGDGTQTDLDGAVTLGAVTVTSANTLAAARFDGAVTLSGNATLVGAGAYRIGGAMNGSGLARSLSLDGAGAKEFAGVVGGGAGLIAGFTQNQGSGNVTFHENVTTMDNSSFAGAVVLDGMAFTGGDLAGDSTTFAGVTLSGGTVTLGGPGSYTVNGAVGGVGGVFQDLELLGGGSKTFEQDVSVAALNQNSGETATFRQNVTTTGNSSFAGAVVLDGMAFTGGDEAGDSTTFEGVTLSGGTVTLGGPGSYTVNGEVDGVGGVFQDLELLGGGSKTFEEAVSVAALNQNLGETATFRQNVTTTGNSSFAGTVVLDEMDFIGGDSAGDSTTFADVTLSSGPVTLRGPGSYTVNGAVGGVGGVFQDLELLGGGTKTFASTIQTDSLTQSGGQIRLGGDVTTSGAVDLENAAITSSLSVDSGADKQSYQTMSLNGDLTAITASDGADDAITLGAGGVNGSGNILLRASNASAGVKIDGLVANTGTFDVRRAGQILLGAGPSPYLDAAEVARIRSSGGAAFVSTSSSVQADTLTANTGLSLGGATTASASGVTASALSLQAGTGAATADSVTVSGDLGLTSTSGGLVFAGSSTAGSLGLDGTSVTDLERLTTPRLGAIRLTAGGLDYRPGGNLTVAGPIRTSGEVVLAPAGNFVNAFPGNPFTAPGVKITTQDFFSYPASAGVPGLLVRYGITGVSQLGNNQIGVVLPLLAGSAGPYITEFTTGTGQPYILATQNNAVPPVFLPVALPGTAAGAFTARPTFTQEEIEMMTPEERSAFEADRRQQATRVILERSGGGEQAIELPTEGEIPQAKGPEVTPPSPTARVFLDGKPLAGKSGKETRDSTQLLRVRPSKVVVRTETDPQEWMESERLTAEVNMVAVPVAGAR